MINTNERTTIRPQLTDAELRAAVALDTDPNFKVIMDFINKRSLMLAMISTDHINEECHWLQGRSKELRDLSNCFKNARKNYEAIRNNGGNK